MMSATALASSSRLRTSLTISAASLCREYTAIQAGRPRKKSGDATSTALWVRRVTTAFARCSRSARAAIS